VNGHLHFHLHPAVFEILLKECDNRVVRAVRLTYDPWGVDAPLGAGRIFYRASHALIFRLLSRRSKGPLKRRNIAFTDHVFGLLENARVSEDYIMKLLEVLPAGNSELYSHPSLDEFKEEHHALISSQVIQKVQQNRIQLIRYQDLWRAS
jgi:hypothetical protein